MSSRSYNEVMLKFQNNLYFFDIGFKKPCRVVCQQFCSNYFLTDLNANIDL